MTPVYGVPKGADHARLRVSAMAFSADGGHSWPEFSVIYEDRKGDINPSETDIIRLSDGRCLAMIRANAAHRLYRSHSDDEGTTWSPLEPHRTSGSVPGALDPGRWPHPLRLPGHETRRVRHELRVQR